MVFDRPPNPGQSQPKSSPTTNRPNPATQKSSSQTPKKIITVGGGGSSGGARSNGGDNGGDNNPPSPWLNPQNEPNPAATASFVEYLRWMRSLDSDYKDPKKVQILQMAEEGAKNYRDRLKQLTDRTRLIAGEKNVFEARCPWRIRVGGHRGPESILLPAFDALGMPYIPSSTLRGIARSQAIRDLTQTQIDKLRNTKPDLSNNDWKEARKQAEKEVERYFGSLEAEESSRSGKVIFLDAYPLESQANLLAVDIANNIWHWNGESIEYQPNPNAFLSLKEPTFLIGLRLASTCKDTTILDSVKEWLKAGLKAGVGSQVNTGYGEMVISKQETLCEPFFQVKFILKGQLIHGCQKFRNISQPFQKETDGSLKRDRQNNLKPDSIPEAEVRPVAFKSMLRYWFRALALGFLSARDVREKWEPKLFGSIQPQTQGWVVFRLTETINSSTSVQDKNKSCLEQRGVLKLSFSNELPNLETQQNNIKCLFKHLTWLMFHLGGVGQGARRPLYSRKNRQNPPWYRGTELRAESDELFQELPQDIDKFKALFDSHLQGFYEALKTLTGNESISKSPPTRHSRPGEWHDAVDSNCRIVVCSGKEEFGKAYALAVLHSDELKVKKFKNGREELFYDTNLCGKTGDRSPVWITNLGDYQVVTVFGAAENPRKNYLKELRDRTSPQNYIQLWPLT